MNCDNIRGCCSPCSQLAQQLEETNTRAVQAYNLAARAFAATHPLVSGRNIDITLNASNEYEVAVKNPMDEDVVINADLTVNGDIYQNGSAYESHAEQLYTTKDTVIMRDGATTGLAPGDVAGLIMKKYDGTNDGALVVGNDGTARVGDVGSEQPLMTRDEAGSMINGELLQWNGTGQKAVCSGVTTAQIVRGSGNIGSDTKPVKVVNGVDTPVSTNLVKQDVNSATFTVLGTTIECFYNDNMVVLTGRDMNLTQTGVVTIQLPVNFFGNYIANIVTGSYYAGYVYTLGSPNVQIHFDEIRNYCSFTIVMLRQP
jgi:hypothetical protein